MHDLNVGFSISPFFELTVRNKTVPNNADKIEFGLPRPKFRTCRFSTPFKLPA